MNHRPIEEIKAELAAALNAEAEKTKGVTPKYLFTLSPTAPDPKLYDSSCIGYTLTRNCLNREYFSNARGGVRRANYLFNTLSGSIVRVISQGSIFPEKLEIISKLSKFIRENPEGGDVTSIMEEG